MTRRNIATRTAIVLCTSFFRKVLGTDPSVFVTLIKALIRNYIATLGNSRTVIRARHAALI